MTDLPRACIGGPGPCSGYALPGRSRCAAHSPKNSGWAKYASQHPERAALYASPWWRERRNDQLRDFPDCLVCGRPAKHADHVVAIALGGRADGPLQSLCAKHHRAKSQEESKEGNRRAAARRRQQGGEGPWVA
jgi:5-methylcytosine-specific restriction endonuclease McrA